MKSKLGLLLGDRNGIGPELVARLLADGEVHDHAQLVVIGDPRVFDHGRAIVGGGPVALSVFAPEPDAAITPGEATAAAGREVLATLAHAARMAEAGDIDGVVFAPLNKQAMHLGGLAFEDEMRFLAHELNYDCTIGELNVLDDLWTSRVTSHVALRDVGDLITEPAVYDAIRFANDALVAAGHAEPKLAVAALNPHAGDGGNFGSEEIEVIGPAIERARRDGIDASGPHSPDTVFVKARDGAYAAVVTMYHDQGQIAMKLMGFGRGVTVLGGLPVAVTTCGHGTAYDIVGRGVANPESLRRAVMLCARMAERREQDNG